MAKRKRNRHEVTCQCSAYSFPHRLGGGQCDGSGWCSSYRELCGDLCETCHCNSRDGCDVISGKEPATKADCIGDELRTENIRDTLGKFPMSLEQRMIKLELACRQQE